MIEKLRIDTWEICKHVEHVCVGVLHGELKKSFTRFRVELIDVDGGLLEHFSNFLDLTFADKLDKL